MMSGKIKGKTARQFSPNLFLSFSKGKEKEVYFSSALAFSSTTAHF
jgi:hypothetical protein